MTFPTFEKKHHLDFDVESEKTLYKKNRIENEELSTAANANMISLITPPDVLRCITLYMDMRSLARFSMVNRSIFKICRTEFNSRFKNMTINEKYEIFISLKGLNRERLETVVQIAQQFLFIKKDLYTQGKAKVYELSMAKAYQLSTENNFLEQKTFMQGLLNNAKDVLINSLFIMKNLMHAESLYLQNTPYFALVKYVNELKSLKELKINCQCLFNPGENPDIISNEKYDTYFNRLKNVISRLGELSNLHSFSLIRNREVSGHVLSGDCANYLFEHVPENLEILFLNRFTIIETGPQFKNMWGRLNSLKELYFDYCEIPEEDFIDHFARIENVTQLEKISFEGCEINDRNVKEIASSPYMKNLKEISLSVNEEISDETAFLIAGSDNFAKTEMLSFVFTSMGFKGAEAILTSSKLPCLKSLMLSDEKFRVLPDGVDYYWDLQKEVESEGAIVQAYSEVEKQKILALAAVKNVTVAFKNPAPRYFS